MQGMPGLPMMGILQYTDADVLCGRKGEAQKHVGNKTYRALVNLNKPLYASCRTTEKIKISRSIVAAIREQQGRFLEKDANTNTYYDIGDKKAVEKTSQALREGQAKLKAQMARNGEYTDNLTAEGARTSLNSVESMAPAVAMGSAPRQPSYQPPPAAQELAPHVARTSYTNGGMQHPGAEVRWEPAELAPPRSRPTMPTGVQSEISLMSDISANFRDMLSNEETRSSFDTNMQEALRHVDVPVNPYYYGNDEEGYTEMHPPPPRRMLETMDSFRRQLMGIASPQTSSMSLTSGVGSLGGTHKPTPLPSNPMTDIHVPPRGQEPAVDDVHFKARPKDAIDDLLSVGGLSKLSLMSGVSEDDMDAGTPVAVKLGDGGGRRLIHNGSSELTLDSAIAPRAGSNRRLMAARGLSTRSTAMSEVSALDYLQEQENEDDDVDVPPGSAYQY